jgi:Protein of unknown function (DUF3179)
MLPGRGTARMQLATGLLFWVVPIVLAVAPGCTVQQDEKPPTIAAVPKEAVSFREILVAPLERPGTLAAKDAGLPPDEKVIGVVVGGKARAYRVKAMEGRSQHLVNDLIAGVPVSVAYCNLTECVRVYTGPAGSGPLDLAVAGLLNDEMVLKVGDTPYFQGSGKLVRPEVLESSHNPVAVAFARNAKAVVGSGQGAREIPYAMLTPVLTTWKSWVEQHPESDVFTGVRAGGSSGSRDDRAP